MYNEGTSLDSCTGHSSADGQYHYHANIVCDSAATDPDTCKQIGWMRYIHSHINTIAQYDDITNYC